MMSTSELYNKLYSTINIRGGMYGDSSRRDSFFIRYISSHIKEPSTFIDLGCGRGHLLRYLRTCGHAVHGTEIADCLMQRGGELYGMPVEKMYYSELNRIPDDSYDVVISNDVLEHLDDDAAVEQAIADIFRISKQYVLISTGGTRAATALVPGTGNLHKVIHPSSWWTDRIVKQLNEESNFDCFEATGSLFMLGVK